MRKPTVNPILLASIGGVLLVALGLVALLGSPVPGSTSSATPPASVGATGPAATPKPANVVTIDPALCALERQPGPDEAPVRGVDGGADGGGGDSQGFDPVDWGTGRWRLCLTGAEPAAVEGSAWCKWSEDRADVFEINGLTLSIGRAHLQGSINVAGKASIGRTAPGSVDVWASTQPLPVDPGDRGRAGAITLDLAYDTTNGESHEAGAPPTPGPVTGTIRWSCGEPPPSRPGLATGQITLHLDRPINTDWTSAARCTWVTGAPGPRLAEVTLPVELTAGDLRLNLSIRPNARFPDAIDASLDVRDNESSDTYSPSAGLISYRQAVDAASGLVRLRGLVRQPGGGAVLGGIDELSGFASWSCDPPATDGLIGNDADPPVDMIVPGTATLSFSPAAIQPIRGPVRCQITAEDLGGIGLLGIDGTIQVGAGAVLVHADQGELRLALAGADGLPAGEYQGGLTEMRADVLFGDLGLRATVDWGPDDPRYVPIGGPGGPHSLSVTVGVTCDVRQARIPGLTLGTLELTLGSGIDRTWSLPVACSWRLRDGAPVVVQAVNAERLLIGDQTFRTYLRPELFITSERGTRYGKLIASTVGGPIALDGSSGTLTFTDFGPLGRITNINDRLGGRAGPLKISGSAAWTCGQAPANAPPETPSG